MADEGIQLSALDSAGLLNGNESLFIERDGLPLKTTANGITKSNSDAIVANSDAIAANTAAIGGKLDKVTLLSITTPVTPTLVNQKYYDSTSKLIFTSLANLTWDAGVVPTSGVIYLFGSTNYVWNGLEFFEIGESASDGGSGLNSVEASVLTDFNDILTLGVYTITGPLNGLYIGSFEYPNVIQTVIWDNKIFKRGVNVSGQTIIYPPFIEAYATNEAMSLKADLVGGVVPYTELPPNFTGKIDVKFWQNSQPNNPIDSDYWLDQTMPHHSILSVFNSTDLHWNPLVVDSTKIYKNLNDNSIWTWGGDSMVPISDPLLYTSQTEAQTGTENTKVMTALSTVQSWYYQAKNYVIAELNTVSKNLVGAINELKSGKADLVGGTVPLNQLPSTLANCIILQSITTIPDNYISGQLYYNAVDNKIYLCVGGSTGVIDWSNYAKGQILKFDVNYYMFSDKLNLVGANKLKIGLCKNGANGLVNPQIVPAENYDRIITGVNLASNCSDVNVTIGADTYDHTTLLNTVLPAGTEMIINDITVKAGGTNANAIIIIT